MNPDRAAYGLGIKHDPKETERAILLLLAELPLWHSLHPRVIQYRMLGTDKVGADATNSAVGRLHNARLIKRSGPYGGGRKFMITDAGRAALNLADVIDEAS